jgi:hypothetical protein
MLTCLYNISPIKLETSGALLTSRAPSVLGGSESQIQTFPHEFGSFRGESEQKSRKIPLGKTVRVDFQLSRLDSNLFIVCGRFNAVDDFRANSRYDDKLLSRARNREAILAQPKCHQLRR